MATEAAQTIYLWQGFDKNGKKTQGEMPGASQALVKAQLRKQGVNPTKVKRKPKDLFGPRKQAIKPADIAVFTRQLATMMKSGIPLVQSFEIVGESLENPSMRELVLAVRDDVAAGNNFADCIRKHPRYFDDLYCNLVEAGEASGALETMLDRLATYKEKSEALKAKIKKAMNYPIAVVCVAIIVTGILLVKVVPQFAETFSSFGADLPAFTLFVLNLSDLAIAHWWKVLIGAVVGGLAYKEAMVRSKSFSDGVERFSLKLPIVGPILNSSCYARFTRTLGILTQSAVPIVQALSLSRQVVSNQVIKQACEQTATAVREGSGLARAMQNTGVFPPLSIKLIHSGEQSGQLSHMLERVARVQEKAVENKLKTLIGALQPLAILFVGLMVLFIVLAMLLPIFQINTIIN